VNANGDPIPSGTAQSIYCSECRRFLRYSGRRVAYSSDDVIVWVECDYCRGRREAEEAEEAERRRRAEEKVRPVVCGLEGCQVTFVRATAWQAFCCDEHRWRAHRLLKAQRRREAAAERRLRLVS
jgi:hypothetical protein